MSALNIRTITIQIEAINHDRNKSNKSKREKLQAIMFVYRSGSQYF